MVLDKDLSDVWPLFDPTISFFVLERVRLKRGICLEKDHVFSL